MTREMIRARQAQNAPTPAQLVRVTIQTVSPLTVNLRGTVVPGVAVTGLTYTVGGNGYAIYQEPAVGPVFPTA